MLNNWMLRIIDIIQFQIDDVISNEMAADGMKSRKLKRPEIQRISLNQMN